MTRQYCQQVSLLFFSSSACYIGQQLCTGKPLQTKPKAVKSDSRLVTCTVTTSQRERLSSRTLCEPSLERPALASEYQRRHPVDFSNSLNEPFLFWVFRLLVSLPFPPAALAPLFQVLSIFGEWKDRCLSRDGVHIITMTLTCQGHTPG